MNLKSIINLFSILVIFFSISFVFPMLVSWIYMDKSLNIFITTFLIVFTFGLSGWYFTKGSIKDLSQSDGFIIITFFWIILSVAARYPSI